MTATSNTFYPQLKPLAPGSTATATLAAPQLKTEDTLAKTSAFFHQKTKSNAKAQSFDLNASGTGKVLSS